MGQLDAEWIGRQLIVRLPSDLARSQVLLMLPEIISATARHGGTGVLIDCTASDLLPKAEERILMAAKISAIWPRHLAMAILVQPELQVPDNTFVHGLTKFGVTAETFHIRQDALRWLQQFGGDGNNSDTATPARTRTE
jgi:hypothetical protein